MRRHRARLIAALAAGAVTTLALSGCTLIEEIQTLGTAGPTDSAGATEGPVDADVAPELREFYEQELEWGECPPERAAPEEYECATLSAPMDWNDPAAHEPIELALIRLPASGESQGSMFTNPGGPGASGVDFVAGAGTTFFSAELQANYDIVGWDPRGVGASSAVECRDDAGMDEHFYGVPEGWSQMSDEEKLQASIQEQIRFGADCLTNTGDLLGFVDTRSTVRDLDMMRAVVGDDLLTYFGLSYGTDIGAQYIDMFPERVGRIVLDGATDPTVPAFDVILDQQEKFGDATRTYLEDCIATPGCPFRSKDVDGAIEEIRTIMDEVDASLPKGPDGRTLTSGVISTAISAAMYDESSWAYLSQAFKLWYESADPSYFFLLSDTYFGRDMNGHYDSNMFEAFSAINCLDYPLVTDAATIRAFNEKLKEVSLFGGATTEAEMEIGDVTCENWPVPPRVTEQKPVVGAGAAPVLVVATTNDPATPLKWAEAVAEQLESGVLVVYEGEGHIAYDEGDKCLMGTVDDYFVEGKVPDDKVTC